MSNSGIYRIENTKNQKYYIGSSVNIKKRWRDHIKYLTTGTHHCSHLQNAWNKYGANTFVFSIVELVDKKNLLLTEQIHLNNAFETGMQYNTNRIAGSSLGTKRTPESMKNALIASNTPEAIAKMSKTKKLFFSTKEGREQHHKLTTAAHSLKAREKMSQTHSLRAKTIAGKNQLQKALNASKLPNNIQRMVISLCPDPTLVFKPDGTHDWVINKAEYCRNHNLSSGSFNSIITGKRKSHKGFQAKRVLCSEIHNKYWNQFEVSDNIIQAYGLDGGNHENI